MEETNYERKRRGYSFFEQNRRRLSKALLVVAALVIILTRGSLTDCDSGKLVFFGGIVLIILGILGRVWATMYIGGRKNASLVQKGPYSLCRNPLYFFSFLGGLGATFVFGNILLILLFVGFFSVFYPKVIESEEGRLRTYFGDEFDLYKASTPAFFPNPMRLDLGEKDDISTVRVWKNMLDSSAFLLAVPLSLVIDHLHDGGWLPTLLTF